MVGIVIFAFLLCSTSIVAADSSEFSDVAIDGDLQAVVADQSRVIADQQRRLELLESSLEDLMPVAAQSNSPIVGYDGGFVIAGENEKLDSSDIDYRMRIGSWGQFRHNFFDSDGPNPDQNDFDIERVRLVFDGFAFHKDFTYFFQLDGDSDASETVDLLDYYLTYAVNDRLKIRMGKWKIGFNRAREESGAKMQFSDRSMASVLFDFDRSLGIGLLGTQGDVDWQVALANGIDTGGFRPSRANQLDRNFAVATRANWLVSGDWGKDGHADLDCRTTPAIRVGMGYTYSRRENEGLREFDFPRIVDSGQSLSTILPLGVDAYDQSMFATDFNLKYRGMSVVFEYYWRTLQDVVPASLDDQGFWLETGYFLRPKRWQILGRWSRVSGNSGTLGGADQSADEIAVGSVFYIRGHNLKMTFDASHFNGAPISDSALNVRPGDAGMLYRSQFQWKF